MRKQVGGFLVMQVIDCLQHRAGGGHCQGPHGHLHHHTHQNGGGRGKSSSPEKQQQQPLSHPLVDAASAEGGAEGAEGGPTDGSSSAKPAGEAA